MHNHPIFDRYRYVELAFRSDRVAVIMGWF
jgi:hypothetical protein